MDKATEPYKDAAGSRVRRPRLRRRATTSPSSTRRELPVHAVFATPRTRTVKSPAWLNDPTMYHNRGDSLRRRELRVRRLLRPRRPVHRASRGRRRHDRHLRAVGRPSASTASASTPSSTSTSSSGSSSAPAIEAYAAGRRQRRTSSCSARSSAPTGAAVHLHRPRASCSPSSTSASRTRRRASPPARRGRRTCATSSPTTTATSTPTPTRTALPTFLGNHDMGRIGTFIASGNPGATDAELLARDRLAHVAHVLQPRHAGRLLRRRAGLHRRRRRQGRPPGHVPVADRRRTSTTTRSAPTPPRPTTTSTPTHPLYTTITELADAARGPRRPCAPAPSCTATRPTAPASSPSPASTATSGVEYLVASNNARGRRHGDVRAPTRPARRSPRSARPAGHAADGRRGRHASPSPCRRSAPRCTSLRPRPIAHRRGHRRAPIDVTAPAAARRARPGRPRPPRRRRRCTPRSASPPYRRRAVDLRRHRRQRPLPRRPRHRPALDGRHDRRGPGRSSHDMAGHTAPARRRAGRRRGAAADPAGGLRTTLVVHYQRADGDVDDGGLCDLRRHRPGLMASARAPTACVARRGRLRRFRWIELTAAARPGHRLHRASTRPATRTAPTPTASSTPRSRPEIWLQVRRRRGLHVAGGRRGLRDRALPPRPTATTTAGACTCGATARPGAGTDWTAPRPPDGVDEFGAYWNVPVDDVDAALNFIVHKGDEKDPGPDQSLVPSQQPTAWIVSGDATVHRHRGRRRTSRCCTTAARPATTATTVDELRRLWGLHIWTGAAHAATELDQPAAAGARRTASARSSRCRWPTARPCSTTSSTRATRRTCPPTRRSTWSPSATRCGSLAGEEGYLLLRAGRRARPSRATSRRSEAHWLERGTSSRGTWTTPTATYTLHTSADGGLELAAGGVDGGESDRAGLLPRTLPGRAGREVRRTWPGYAALGRAATTSTPAEALRGPARRRRRRPRRDPHRRDRGAGPRRARRPLRRRRPRRRAGRHLGRRRPDAPPSGRPPPARSTLHRFADPAAPAPGTTTAMTLDDGLRRLVRHRRGRLGPASTTCSRSRSSCPRRAQVERNVVTDPYSLSPVDQLAPSRRSSTWPTPTCSPEGWSSVGNPGARPRPRRSTSTSSTCGTSPSATRRCRRSCAARTRPSRSPARTA